MLVKPCIPAAHMQHSVFISHSTKNQAMAELVLEAIEAQGIGCWIAPRDIPGGATWAGSIMEAIQTSRLMILIFSADAQVSQHVVREVERAVHHGIPILPVRVDETTPHNEMEYFLGPHQWMNAISPPFESHLHDVVHRAKALLAPRPSPETYAPTLAANPQPRTKRPLLWIAGLAALVAIGFAVWRLRTREPATAVMANDRNELASASSPSSVPTETSAADLPADLNAEVDDEIMPNGSMSLGAIAPSPWRVMHIQRGKVRLVRDTRDYVTGPSSLCVMNIVGPTEGEVSAQFTYASNLPVMISGMMKCEGNVHAQLGTAQFDARATRRPIFLETFLTLDPAEAWTKWKKFEHVVTPADGAKLVAIGIQFKGEGKVWLDDLSVRVLRDKTAASPTTRPHPKNP